MNDTIARTDYGLLVLVRVEVLETPLSRFVAVHFIQLDYTRISFSFLLITYIVYINFKKKSMVLFF